MNAQSFQTARMIACAILLVFACAASAFYDPFLGRWISRDPIGEPGGMNLYGFLKNDSLSYNDFVGLAPYLPPGTIKSSPVQNGGNVLVTVGSQFNQSDKTLASKALCLIRKLLSQQLYYPYYSDTYWATLANLPANGITMPSNPSQPKGDKWVFIASSSRPSNETQLLAMARFGATLAHEFDHYYSISDDAPGGPEDRIDNPVINKFSEALGKNIYCTPCNRHNPTWWIENQVEKYACECDINLNKKSN